MYDICNSDVSNDKSTSNNKALEETIEEIKEHNNGNNSQYCRSSRYTGKDFTKSEVGETDKKFVGNTTNTINKKNKHVTLSSSSSTIIVENVSDGTPLFTFTPCSSHELREYLYDITKRYDGYFNSNDIRTYEGTYTEFTNMYEESLHNSMSDISNENDVKNNNNLGKANTTSSIVNNVDNHVNCKAMPSDIINKHENADFICTDVSKIVNVEDRMENVICHADRKAESCQTDSEEIYTTNNLSNELSANNNNITYRKGNTDNNGSVNNSSKNDNDQVIIKDAMQRTNESEIISDVTSLLQLRSELALLEKIVSTHSSILAGAESLETGVPLQYTLSAITHATHLLSTTLSSITQTLASCPVSVGNMHNRIRGSSNSSNSSSNVFSREELLADVQSRLPITLQRQICSLEKEHQHRYYAEHEYLLFEQEQEQEQEQQHEELLLSMCTTTSTASNHNFANQNEQLL